MNNMKMSKKVAEMAGRKPPRPSKGMQRDTFGAKRPVVSASKARARPASASPAYAKGGMVKGKKSC
jgi:hypothetical protein